MDEITHGLPLGICKQAVMKLDSVMSDMKEVLEDEDLSPENRAVVEQITEWTGTIMAAIVNMVSQEIGEEEFIAELVEMEEISAYPEDESDAMDAEIHM